MNLKVTTAGSHHLVVDRPLEIRDKLFRANVLTQPLPAADNVVATRPPVLPSASFDTKLYALYNYTTQDKSDIAFITGVLGKGQTGSAAIAQLLARR